MDNLLIKNILKQTNLISYDKKWEKDIIKESIKVGRNNGLDNIVIVFEELAELEQVITKEIRGKGNKFAAIEEVADVVLGMEFINNVYNIDIDTKTNYKKETKKSLFVILKDLVILQNQILKLILEDDIKELKGCCLNIMKDIEIIKEHFQICEEDIIKMKIFKLNRLKERIEKKELI